MAYALSWLNRAHESTDEPRFCTRLPRRAEPRSACNSRTDWWAARGGGDDLALGGVKGQSAAQVSAVADLQGVMSSFDWYLDRVVHFERPDTLTVDHDIERATMDLHSDRFMRQLESCRHLQSPFCVSRSAVASCFDHEGVTAANQQ
jgi:hypothetical protein